jgi:hypothetical protein
MIAVASNPPADECLAEVEQQLKVLREQLQHGEKLTFKAPLYKRFRNVLEDAFFKKCAYCETKLDALIKPTIEHYRPKAGITGVAGHPGYYWLAFAWGNLLPVCNPCNSAKANKFPLKAGTHVSPEGSIDAEVPLLLNPLTPGFNPSQHFLIQDDGKLVGRTPEGESTIEICNLNRERLVEGRRDFMKQVRVFFATVLTAIIQEQHPPSGSEVVEAIKIGSAQWAFAGRTARSRAKEDLDKSGLI